MLALAAAVLITAQITGDGKSVDRKIPDDLVTWRWLTYQDRAVLGWGRIDAKGLFVPVNPHPPWPLFERPADEPVDRLAAEKPPTAEIDRADDHSPTSKRDGPTIGALPAFAVNGVVTERIASDGVTLRASDPETAREGRRILMETKAVDAVEKKPPDANCPEDPAKIKIPTPTVQVGPDFEKLGLSALPAVLAVFAGWIYRSSSPPGT